MAEQDPPHVPCPFCHSLFNAGDLDAHIRQKHPHSGYTEPFASHFAGLNLTGSEPASIEEPIIVLHSMSFRGKWSGYLAELTASDGISIIERDFFRPSVDERSEDGLGLMFFDLYELEDGVYAARSANERQHKPREQHFLVSHGRVAKLLTWSEVRFYVHGTPQEPHYDEVTHECYLAMSTLYHHGVYGCEQRAQLVRTHLATSKVSDPTLHLRLSIQVTVTAPLLAIEHLQHIHPEAMARFDQDSPLCLPPLSGTGSPAQMRLARSLRARVLRQLRMLQYAARDEDDDYKRSLIHTWGPGVAMLFTIYLQDIGTDASHWIDFRRTILDTVGNESLMGLMSQMLHDTPLDEPLEWEGSYESAIQSMGHLLKQLGLEPIKAPDA